MNGKRKLKLNGEPHRLVVLKVLRRDVFGRPSEVAVVYDDTKIEAERGAQYYTAFIHDSATGKVRPS